MSIQIKVKGSRQVQQELLDLEKQFPKAMLQALTEEALIIFEESQDQVPVDTGRLQDSGVVGTTGTAKNPEVIIAYGTNYGLPVHEREEVPHVTGKAKFLEDPFLDAEPGMPQRLAKRVKRIVGGKVE